MIDTVVSSIATASGVAAVGSADFTQVLKGAFGDADSFNKVWGVLIAAFAAIVAAAVGSLATAMVQLFGAYQQRKHERKVADEESVEIARLAENKLAMADATSQRKASAKVAQMRQVWINELRTDTASYLALWQDIAYRWAGIIADPNQRAFSSVTAESLNAPIAKMRLEAHELQLRIKMRLNSSEQTHKELRLLMEELERVVGRFRRDMSGKSGDVLLGETSRAIQTIVDKQQEILKNEWNVVKSELGLDRKKVSQNALLTTERR